MLKWLLALLIVLVILTAMTPWLQRYGLGRLPGDFRMAVRGRIYRVPFTSTVLLSALVWLIGKIL
jgi:hypothetical protein